MPISKGELFTEQDIYIDHSFEEVMYRWDHTARKCYVKFYGKKESDNLVPHDNRLFNDALLYGEQITKEEYEKGKTKTMNLDKALAIAIQAHKGQVDKAGEPYILHPLRLMNQFIDKDLMIVSVLHDVVEDSDFTLKDLVDSEFSPIIIDAVDCLTKRENEEYTNFIERVMTNPLAIKVKIADIKDNLNISRFYKLLSEKDINRLKKYQIALLRLQQIKDNAFS